MLKAFKINVTTQQVEPLEIPNDYKQIYKLLDIEGGTFTVVHLDEANDLYVDDEALLKNFDKLPGGFIVGGQVLFGHGVVIGTDRDGDAISASISLKQLQNMVHLQLPQPWLRAEFERLSNTPPTIIFN